MPFAMCLVSHVSTLHARVRPSPLPGPRNFRNALGASGASSRDTLCVQRTIMLPLVACTVHMFGAQLFRLTSSCSYSVAAAESLTLCVLRVMSVHRALSRASTRALEKRQECTHTWSLWEIWAYA